MFLNLESKNDEGRTTFVRKHKGKLMRVKDIFEPNYDEQESLSSQTFGDKGFKTDDTIFVGRFFKTLWENASPIIGSIAGAQTSKIKTHINGYGMMIPNVKNEAGELMCWGKVMKILVINHQ